MVDGGYEVDRRGYVISGLLLELGIAVPAVVRWQVYEETLEWRGRWSPKMLGLCDK